MPLKKRSLVTFVVSLVLFLLFLAYFFSLPNNVGMSGFTVYWILIAAFLGVIIGIVLFIWSLIKSYLSRDGKNVSMAVKRKIPPFLRIVYFVFLLPFIALLYELVFSLQKHTQTNSAFIFIGLYIVLFIVGVIL